MHDPRTQQQREGGFTLVELLITLAVLGVLTAVAIVGLQGIVNNGNSASCQTSMDAAKAATAAYYTKTGANYPQTFTQLTNPPTGTPLLVPDAHVTETATTLSGKGWTVKLTPGPTVTDRITFTGC